MPFRFSSVDDGIPIYYNNSVSSYNNDNEKQLFSIANLSIFLN
jgi:hypothetical protein